jgi:hypothetical protein
MAVAGVVEQEVEVLALERLREQAAEIGDEAVEARDLADIEPERGDEAGPCHEWLRPRRRLVRAAIDR